MWWPAIGGLIIGIGGLIEPRALGVGYDVIDELLTGKAGLSLIFGILFVKTIIWSLSLGSGTSGGVLAPVFMIGGALGALEGHLLPDVFPGFWAMMGLAAVVGGVMRSPLTGVIFTLELTHVWGVILPLVIAATTAYAVSCLILKRSVLTEKIARHGLHLTREYSTDPLETFFVNEVMDIAPLTLAPNEAVAEVASRLTVDSHAHSQRLIPVTGKDGQLAAVVTIGGVMTARHRADSGPLISDLMRTDVATVFDNDTLRHVANVFAEHEVTRAPVVDRDAPDRLLGVISLEDLLHARKHDLGEEHVRERHLLVRRPVAEGD